MEKTAWTTHAEFVILFITMLGGFYMIDSKCERAHERIDTQGARIDRAYEMFYEIVKEKR